MSEQPKRIGAVHPQLVVFRRMLHEAEELAGRKTHEKKLLTLGDPIPEGPAPYWDWGDPQMRMMQFPYQGVETTVGILKAAYSELPSPLEIFQVVADINANYRFGLRIIRPALADYLLNEGDGWKFLAQAYVFITDAIVAHGKRNEPLDRWIRFSWPEIMRPPPPFFFPVPEEYVGRRNMAFVLTECTIDDFKQKEMGIQIRVSPERLRVFQDFPDDRHDRSPVFPRPYRYCIDPETTLPHGGRPANLSGEPDWEKRSRYLGTDDEGYAGPLWRAVNAAGQYQDRVFTNSPPFYGGRYRIVVEVPDSDLPKIKPG